MTPELSWVESANDPECGFGLENLPWCRFNGGRLGVRAGDFVLDLADIGLSAYDREQVYQALHVSSARPHPTLIPVNSVAYELPYTIGDYTDFYASIHHATNVGKLFRPDSPLLPNYRHLPVAYHGRASSVVISGTDVRRPWGQLSEGKFGASQQLDYELELGIWIGEGNTLGSPVPILEAGQKIAGFCLVNDWSARDIQRWEYQPLGPFLGKSFATSVSPWVVVPETLKPYRLGTSERDETLSYLTPPGHSFDITLEVWVNGARTCRSNTRDLFWTCEQMIAHHTSNGCNLRIGDLLASGTVSGSAEDSKGCLLESGLPFLKDGDEVVLLGYAKSPRLPKISFGECRGRVLPALENYF
ncbi:MAG: fumarylacetoacetase [Bryobacteraceae bacterium]|nr:fumarylacetoacetase [Bryobacteraceae bacterium]